MRFRFSGIFIDKIKAIMLIILPTIILMATTVIMVLLMLIKPGFRFHWLIATIGAFISTVAVLLWQTKLASTFSLPAWKPQTIFLYSPSWLADDVSWPYGLSLAALGLATITTAVIRKFSSPWNWASILFLTSIGLLTVSAENPLTLVIAWFAMDLIELAILLRMVKEENSEELVVGFSIRIIGVFLLLWASIVSISSGVPFSFREVPDGVGTLLLLAALLRLGVIPLHLPIYDREQRRGIITTLRLISSVSGFSLIARIPSTAFPDTILPLLIIIIGLFTIVSGWMWLRSTDELSGRPYLLSGFGFLAITAMLLGNPRGSVAWGISMILSGGLLFMYSSRGRSTAWLLVIGLWGLSTLPFSLTSSVWINPTDLNNLLLIPHILGYSFILTGFFRHAFTQQGDLNIELEPRWVQVIYPVGLSILPLISLAISVMDWFQTRTIGLWWVGSITLILSLLIYFLFHRFTRSSIMVKLRYKPGKINFISIVFWAMYRFIRKIISLLTSILEGDGGMLWSIVIIVLFISIISQVIQISQ